jgi:putative membrane protein
MSVFDIERPHENLFKYYVLKSLAALPALPVMLPVLYFRYHTMRYRFDEQGISMSWGILFRHQIVLNYSRIQDVHLRSNFIERWLGLARVDVQTASGSGSAEMTIEGLQNYEEIRDFLYSRMRGAKQHAAEAQHTGEALVATALTEVAGELRAMRKLIEERGHV